MGFATSFSTCLSAGSGFLIGNLNSFAWRFKVGVVGFLTMGFFVDEFSKEKKFGFLSSVIVGLNSLITVKYLLAASLVFLV